MTAQARKFCGETPNFPRPTGRCAWDVVGLTVYFEFDLVIIQKRAGTRVDLAAPGSTTVTQLTASLKM